MGHQSCWQAISRCSRSWWRRGRSSRSSTDATRWSRLPWPTGMSSRSTRKETSSLPSPTKVRDALRLTREGPVGPRALEEGALFAETRSSDQVVVHLRSKSPSARQERLLRSRISAQFRRVSWSGRQDLNLRPPGPELLSRRFPLLRRLRTPSQPLEPRKSERHAKLLNPRHATTCEARFVAPVSPATMRASVTQPRNVSLPWAKSLRGSACAARRCTACASAGSSPTFASPTASGSPPAHWLTSLTFRRKGGDDV